MLQSMLATKTTVAQRQQLNAMQPKGEEIAVELVKEQMTSKMAQQKKQIAQDDYERLKKCEKIFEPLQ